MDTLKEEVVSLLRATESITVDQAPAWKTHRPFHTLGSLYRKISTFFPRPEELIDVLGIPARNDSPDEKREFAMFFRDTARFFATTQSWHEKLRDPNFHGNIRGSLGYGVARDWIDAQDVPWESRHDAIGIDKVLAQLEVRAAVAMVLGPDLLSLPREEDWARLLTERYGTETETGNPYAHDRMRMMKLVVAHVRACIRDTTNDLLGLQERAEAACDAAPYVHSEIVGVRGMKDDAREYRELFLEEVVARSYLPRGHATVPLRMEERKAD